MGPSTAITPNTEGALTAERATELEGDMKLVAAGVNGVYLDELLKASPPYTSKVEAAVAFAHDSTFFDFLWERNIPLTYYGLLSEEGAVSLSIIKKFLERSSPQFRCLLVREHFHSKVIWWHGYGAYIGSANLTSAAWWKNIECGVFCPESELVQLGLAQELSDLFEKIESHAFELRSEVLDALKGIEDNPDRKKLDDARRDRFNKKLAFVKLFQGLDRVPAKGEKSDRGRIEFLDEWNRTLQLLRTLSSQLERSGRRPTWLPAGMPAAVHFDQLLHSFYEQQVLHGDDEGKSVEKVEAYFERNRKRAPAAFEEAVEWWCSLPHAPNEEDVFIMKHAPRVRALLGPDGIKSLNEDGFVEACQHLHAFRNHARQVESSLFNLPADHHESMNERAERLARWVWRQQGPGGKSFHQVLSWVLHGPKPASAEERLWAALRDPAWMVQHFSISSFGEAIGWSQPDRYPPRNNRTNKALRALGFPVHLYYGD